jgi:hypothetical protein
MLPDFPVISKWARLIRTVTTSTTLSDRAILSGMF